VKLQLVYIAGPFRAKSHWGVVQNIRKAEALALRVWAHGGLVAICPHLNTAHFQQALKDDVWLEGDLEILRRCDALLTVNSWWKSLGSVAEVKFAKVHHIPIFHTVETLAEYYNCPRPARIVR
jgi:hypothetical protein